MRKVKTVDAQIKLSSEALETAAQAGAAPNLKDPRVVLSLLEADQVVVAKQRSRFGRRRLSIGVRVMLWGLRVYVIIMVVLVVISAFRAIHPAH
jgi:hypothetical protein